MKSINQKINIRNFLEKEELLKNNKAILINETSVYKEYAILKDKSLTLNGNFDLVQISNLRVYAGDFLKSVRLKLCLTQREFLQKYNFSKSALAHWEKDRCAIPLKTLIKIAEDASLTIEKVYEFITEKRILTKKKVNLSFKYEDFIEILPYISIMGKNALIIKQTGKKCINKISKLFNIKIYHSTNKQFVIKNRDLFHFIDTFFDIKLILRISLPKTDFIKNLKNIDIRKAVICPLLQTDGCGTFDKRKNSYYLSLKNISKELHDIFVDSVYFSYNKFLPNSYLLKEKNKHDGYSDCYVTRYAEKDLQSIYTNLMEICGNFKTSKYHSQNMEDYQKEPKPHLDYLLNAKKDEKIIAFRIWASAEGAIIPMGRKKGGLIVPKLQISCANKKLLFQLEKVAKNIGLHFTIRKENKIGYKCLYNSAISCVLSFLKLGGFIGGIKISKSSKYYEGIGKQDLVFATLEYMTRERKNVYLRKMSIKDVHKRIRKIAENKEFKKLDYYITFFSQNDKVKKCLDY